MTLKDLFPFRADDAAAYLPGTNIHPANGYVDTE